MAEGLELVDLEIRKSDTLLLRLSVQVKPGQVVTVMGASGSGKSTLLSAIAGNLNRAFTMSGQLRLNGRDITQTPANERRIGMMFQDPLLFPHLNVGGNLGFGLPPGPKRKTRIEKALNDIGLPGFADRDPATLSGGQAARVALMRSLLAEPQALLLDEPFSKLDAELRDQIRTLTFAQTQNLPVLMVTHDQADARAANGPIIRL